MAASRRSRTTIFDLTTRSGSQADRAIRSLDASQRLIPSDEKSLSPNPARDVPNRAASGLPGEQRRLDNPFRDVARDTVSERTVTVSVDDLRKWLAAASYHCPADRRHCRPDAQITIGERAGVDAG